MAKSLSTINNSVLYSFKDRSKREWNKNKSTVYNQTKQVLVYLHDIVILARTMHYLVEAIKQTENPSKDKGLMINKNKYMILWYQRSLTNRQLKMNVDETESCFPNCFFLHMQFFILGSCI